MNELEMQLRSWAPRRPAAKLKERLLALESTAGDVDSAIGSASPMEPLSGFRLSWLAPVTVSLVLAAVLFSQHTSPAISGTTSNTPMVAMILSNQSAAAYLPGTFHRAQNEIRNRTFEWTNGSGSTSSIRSLSFWARGNH
jgi:hypothetical protein